MALFYNPSWLETQEHLTLFLAKVPDPAKIKTWDELRPYLISEIATLVEETDQNKPNHGLSFSLRMIEDLLHPDLLHGIIDWENPNPKIVANVILDYAPYQNKIWELKQRIKADKLNPRRMPRDLLREVYNERNLRSILELL